MNITVCISHCKCSTAKFRGFDLDRKKRECFLQNCIDHTLIICDPVVDYII